MFWLERETRVELATWFSTDRFGHRHKIKNPVAQAKRSKFALKAKLADCDDTRRFDYGLAHAVAFPDGAVGQELGPELPREIVLDMPRVQDLQQSIIDAYQYHHSEPPEPGDAAIDALRGLLAPSWEIKVSKLGARLGESEEQIRQLTEEQFTVLDLLSRQPRALISGAAGTGKTMLALLGAVVVIAFAGCRTILRRFAGS